MAGSTRNGVIQVIYFPFEMYSRTINYFSKLSFNSYV